jgi:pilus assembly protein CpaB
VTLIVTEEQALKLVEAEYTGKIHLVFERRNF